MSSRITKACDGCRVRKVKCNGAHPCGQCSHLDLPCHFAPPAGKRKPGVRGRLVAKVREGATGASQSQSPSPHEQQPLPVEPSLAATASPSYSTHSALSSLASPTSLPAVTSLAAIVNPETDNPTYPLVASQQSSPYPTEFFLRLVPDFETTLYPFNPVLTPDEIRVAITTMNENPEDAALVYAFAAVTINLTHLSWHLNGDVTAQMEDLIQRCLIAHRQVDQGQGKGVLSELSISVKRIITCIFLEICLMAFRSFNRSFTILREGITMVQTLHVSLYKREDTKFDRREVARRQRLYWECFIHERFVSIMSGHPSILPPLSTGLPYPDLSIPSSVELGFRRLIQLFRIMDDSFLSFWDAQQNGDGVVSGLTAEWIEQKQSELDRDELDAAEDEQRSVEAGGAGMTELQQADLFVTRLWMRTLIWQLALSRGLLRTTPSETCHAGLSLHFPAQRLSAQLRSVVSRLQSFASIGTQGSGILQKLFEITSTVADVLALPPPPPSTPSVSGNQSVYAHEDATARMEDFVYIVLFLFRFERISKQERDYMRDKLEALRQLYTMVDFHDLASSPMAYHNTGV